MSFTRNIGNTLNPLTSESDIIYEDDGFFSDVPISGSLSRSMLALNKYVKQNLLCDENDEFEENNDIAYFSKESSPNDSVIKCDNESFKSNYSDEKIEEVKSELVSTLVFTSKVSSEPVNETIYNNEQTDDCNSTQLFNVLKTNEEEDSDISGDCDFVCNERYHYLNEYEPKFETSAFNIYQPSKCTLEKVCNNSRTVTNTVVRIAYSDFRRPSEFDSHSFDNSISQKKLLPNYSDIVSTAVKLIEENDTNSSFKYDTTTASLHQRQSQAGNNFQPDLGFDSAKDQIVNSNCDEVNNSSCNLSDIQYEQEPPQILHEYFIYNTETGSDNDDSETREIRENRYRLEKQENRQTIHDFTEWGNRTNIYPDVYAPLPYSM